MPRTLGIPAPEYVDFSKFCAEDSALMDEVYEVYGQFSAWKLRNMTHEEASWKNTPIGSEITNLDFSSPGYSKGVQSQHGPLG